MSTPAYEQLPACEQHCLRAALSLFLPLVPPFLPIRKAIMHCTCSTSYVWTKGMGGRACVLYALHAGVFVACILWPAYEYTLYTHLWRVSEEIE